MGYEVLELPDQTLATTFFERPYGTIFESAISMCRSNDRLYQGDSNSGNVCDGFSVGVNGV